MIRAAGPARRDRGLWGRSLAQEERLDAIAAMFDHDEPRVAPGRECTRCGEDRTSQFPRGRLGGWCLPCGRKQRREHRLRMAARPAEEIAAEQAARLPDGRKRCWRCRTWRSISEFAPNRRNPDGLQDRCRKCLLALRYRRVAIRAWGRGPWPCTYCGQLGREVDHVVPRAAGGTDDPENLVPCCRTCNRSKRDRPLLAWLATRPAPPPSEHLDRAIAAARRG